MLHKPYRWMLPFFAVVLAVLVIASAVQTDPRPALHGRGPVSYTHLTLPTN